MQWKTRRKFILFLILLVLVLAILVPSCTRPSDPQADKVPLPFESQLIKVACPRESLTSLIQRHGSLWAKTVGARVEAVTTQDADNPQKLEDASVWLIRPAQLARFATADQLRPVPTEVTRADSFGWLGILLLYREKLLKWSGEVYALPILGEAPLCFYRADLLGDTNHRTRFQEQRSHALGPPQTWEEFLEIAEYFADRREPGKRIASLPPLPASDKELDHLFYAVAAPYDRRAILQDDRKRPADVELFSFHYNLATGQPRIDQPAFLHALKLLQKMQAFRPEKSTQTPTTAFADGQAVLCLAEPSAIAQFRKRLPPAAIGVCPVPGSARWFAFGDGMERPAPAAGNSVPYQGAGGWLAVVPRTAPHPEAAFSLLAEMSGRTARSTQVVFNPEWGGGIFRQEQLDADQNWFGFELNAAQTANLKQALQQTVARPGLLNAVVCLRTPDQRAYRQALDEQLRLALTKGQDAQEALRTAKKRWEVLDAAKSVEIRKKEYLLSLGLMALP
jgi:multiple sugar transport system substrate-binding protein